MGTGKQAKKKGMRSKKKEYKPYKLRLLEGKAAFRKWEQCMEDGTEYSFEAEEVKDTNQLCTLFHVDSTPN